MKVILLTDIKGLGSRYDARNVSDGYARNFLIPRRLAEAATESAVRKATLAKAEGAKKHEALLAESEKKAKELNDRIFNFSLKSGGKGTVFGSVSRKEIERVLADAGFAEAQVEMQKPIKEMGEHKVVVKFGGGVGTEIIVRLQPER